MSEIKKQLEQWIENESHAYEKRSGAVGSVAKNFVRNDFLQGAHSILPMLLVALDTLESYKSAAFDLNGTIYKVGYRAEETLNKIKQMIEVDNG